METKNSAENEDTTKPAAESPIRPERTKTDPLNMQRPPLKDHSNPMIRGFAKAGYTVWIIVLAVGLFLAFVVSLFLV